MARKLTALPPDHGRNPARIGAALARRRSGAAGTHAHRGTRRRRTRGAATRAAIRDQD